MLNLPEVREPFHQLCCVVLVELDVREVHLEHRGAGIAHPEEHQLGLAQVHRCQCRRVQRSQGFAMSGGVTDIGYMNEICVSDGWSIVFPNFHVRVGQSHRGRERGIDVDIRLDWQCLTWLHFRVPIMNV